MRRCRTISIRILILELREQTEPLTGTLKSANVHLPASYEPLLYVRESPSRMAAPDGSSSRMVFMEHPSGSAYWTRSAGCRLTKYAYILIDHESSLQKSKPQPCSCEVVDGAFSVAN